MQDSAQTFALKPNSNLIMNKTAGSQIGESFFTLVKDRPIPTNRLCNQKTVCQPSKQNHLSSINLAKSIRECSSGPKRAVCQHACLKETSTVWAWQTKDVILTNCLQIRDLFESGGPQSWAGSETAPGVCLFVCLLGLNVGQGWSDRATDRAKGPGSVGM